MSTKMKTEASELAERLEHWYPSVEREGATMRAMLAAMQAGEMTVSRGVELLDMWLAGNYTDDQLPPVAETLPLDTMPWDEIHQLRAALAERDVEIQQLLAEYRESVDSAVERGNQIVILRAAAQQGLDALTYPHSPQSWYEKTCKEHTAITALTAALEKKQ